MKLVSIIVPCFNEQQSIVYFCEKINNIELPVNIKLEIVFVDDGSTDSTWTEIQNICDINNKHKLKGIKFTKNFGKESAIFAGLQVSLGESAIIIDCDLQHPVEIIPKMIEAWQSQNIRIVHCVRKNQAKETIFKRILKNTFYKILKNLSGMDLKEHTDFKLIDRVVIDTYLSLPERNRFFKGLISWTGYSSINIEIDISERAIGSSQWSYAKLFSYAKNTIISFSFAPLRLITVIGSVGIVFSIIISIQTLYNYIFTQTSAGFPTVILLILILGSLTLFSLGVIGEYLAEIYIEIKKRPKSIVAEKITNNKLQKDE